MKLKVLSENDLNIIRILFSFTLAQQLRQPDPSGFHDEDRFVDDEHESSAYTVHYTDGTEMYVLGSRNILYAIKIGPDIQWLDSLQIERQFPHHWKLWMKSNKIRPSEARGFIYRSYNERERHQWLEVMRNRP